MNILAIHYGFNASIAYTENGKLLYLLHEEKFDNIKNSMGYPVEAIEYLKTKINVQSIDKIVINPKNLFKSGRNRYLHKTAPNQGVGAMKKYTRRDYLFYHLYTFFPRAFNWYNDYKTESSVLYKKNVAWFAEELTSKLGRTITTSMIEIVEHHITHALSTVYFYGLHKQQDPILLFTLDGAGDRYCASVRVWENDNYRDLGVTRFTHSLGYLRSYVTGALGMKPHEHEYKVMGLAAYTSPKYYMDVYNKLFKGLIWVDEFTFKSKLPINLAHVYLYDKLYGLRFDNIAGALQFFSEELVTEWIRNTVKKTGINKIAVSGGVFMNVKLNKKIHEMEELDRVYFMPSAGDESTVLGQIMNAHLGNEEALNKLDTIETMYNGIDITTQETLDFIEKNVLETKYTVEDLGDDIASSLKVAELLSQFAIVGVCRGKGEWGARSLCNRAILSNASDLKSFHVVNDMIKMRDFRMPFAPTILEEYASIYLKDWEKFSSKVQDSAYYMITAFDSTQIAQEHLRASIHQKDKTLRPQLVNSQTNNRMYTTLKEYNKLTGMGGVMNTSLNIHGYPMVGTLEQALFTFENSGLQYILLDQFLISKKS